MKKYGGTYIDCAIQHGCIDAYIISSDAYDLSKQKEIATLAEKVVLHPKSYIANNLN